MIRLLPAALVVALAGLPLSVLPSLPLAWLTVPVLLLGLGGVAIRSVPLVTSGAALALIEYTFTLVITGARVDVLTATGFGAVVFFLLELVSFADRTHRATIGSAVLASQLRRWLGIAALGVAGTMLVTIGAETLRVALPGGTLPLVVILSALGALTALAGTVRLVSRPSSPTSASSRSR